MQTLSLEEEQRIENAQKALEGISHNFCKWIKKDLDNLYAVFTDILHSGTNANKKKKLYIAIHDLVGNADTMGYVDIQKMGRVLLDLIDSVDDLSVLPKSLFAEYIRIIKCAEELNIRDDTEIENIAKDNLDHLYQLNQKIIKKYAV